jgi:hypothetical protein
MVLYPRKRTDGTSVRLGSRVTPLQLQRRDDAGKRSEWQLRVLTLQRHRGLPLLRALDRRRASMSSSYRGRHEERENSRRKETYSHLDHAFAAVIRVVSSTELSWAW